MSWDILLTTASTKPNMDSDDPEVLPFPPRKEIIQIFKKVFPNFEVSEDGWGNVDGNHIVTM